MQRTLTLASTTIGKKALMAVSGLVLYGFVIAHMLGNLQVFLGPQAINGYAASLKSMAPILWGARGILLASVAVHVWAALSLHTRSHAARPRPYRKHQLVATTPAATSMAFGGAALFVFIVFHLLHFTAPGLALGGHPHSPTDVYANMIHSFSVWWVTAIYLVAQLLLGLHLYHGSWSLLMTLGLSHPRYDRVRNLVPQSIGVGVAGGNALIALSIFAGVVR